LVDLRYFALLVTVVYIYLRLRVRCRYVAPRPGWFTFTLRCCAVAVVRSLLWLVTFTVYRLDVCGWLPTLYGYGYGSRSRTFTLLPVVAVTVCLRFIVWAVLVDAPVPLCGCYVVPLTDVTDHIADLPVTFVVTSPRFTRVTFTAFVGLRYVHTGCYPLLLVIQLVHILAHHLLIRLLPVTYLGC